MSPSTKRILRNQTKLRFDYKIVLISNDWMLNYHTPSRRIGWGNGYVCIPPGHPYHNRDYDEIPVNVHGGLTYGQQRCPGQNNIPPEYYVVGFDTAHSRDSLARWPKEAVLREAQSLQQQLKDLWTNLTQTSPGGLPAMGNDARFLRSVR